MLCVQCGHSSLCSLPCPNCPDVFFCSTQCLQKASASYHHYECPMRLYAILKSTSRGMTSVSVGRMLPLRIATMNPGLRFPKVSKRPEQFEAFETTYHQLMSLCTSPQDCEMAFTEALAELLFRSR